MAPLSMTDYMKEAQQEVERHRLLFIRVQEILRDEQNDEQSDLSHDHLCSRRAAALNRLRLAVVGFEKKQSDDRR